MRALFFALFALMLAPAAAAQPAPGCRAPLHPELIGSADDLDYIVTDTAGLNVVLVHTFGQTMLSDRTCLPDAEQGALSVTVNYGETDSAPPEESARRGLHGQLAVAHMDRRPADFPPINVVSFAVNDLPGAEAFAHDTAPNGAAVFRYALVFVFPDGAKGFVAASGPQEQFEALRPNLRRIAAGLRPRRNVEEMREGLADAVDTMIERLRGPLLDQAFDACMSGAYTRDAAIARAVAAGYPPFQAQPPTRLGERWSRSDAPADDSAQITLGVMEGPSHMISGRSSLTCAIIGSPLMASMFQKKFEARFPGSGLRRMFTVSGGQVRAASGSVRAGPGVGIGSATLDNNSSLSAITIEITPGN